MVNIDINSFRFRSRPTWGESLHFTSLMSPPRSCNRWAKLQMTSYGARSSFSEHKMRYGAFMLWRKTKQNKCRRNWKLWIIASPDILTTEEYRVCQYSTRCDSNRLRKKVSRPEAMPWAIHDANLGGWDILRTFGWRTNFVPKSLVKSTGLES